MSAFRFAIFYILTVPDCWTSHALPTSPSDFQSFFGSDFEQTTKSSRRTTTIDYDLADFDEFGTDPGVYDVAGSSDGMNNIDDNDQSYDYVSGIHTGQSLFEPPYTASPGLAPIGSGEISDENQDYTNYWADGANYRRNEDTTPGRTMARPPENQNSVLSGKDPQNNTSTQATINASQSQIPATGNDNMSTAKLSNDTERKNGNVTAPRQTQANEKSNYTTGSRKVTRTFTFSRGNNKQRQRNKTARGRISGSNSANSRGLSAENTSGQSYGVSDESNEAQGAQGRNSLGSTESEASASTNSASAFAQSKSLGSNESIERHSMYDSSSNEFISTSRSMSNEVSNEQGQADESGIEIESGEYLLMNSNPTKLSHSLQSAIGRNSKHQEDIVNVTSLYSEQVDSRLSDSRSNERFTSDSPHSNWIDDNIYDNDFDDDNDDDNFVAYSPTGQAGVPVKNSMGNLGARSTKSPMLESAKGALDKNETNTLENCFRATGGDVNKVCYLVKALYSICSSQFKPECNRGSGIQNQQATPASSISREFPQYEESGESFDEDIFSDPTSAFSSADVSSEMNESPLSLSVESVEDLSASFERASGIFEVISLIKEACPSICALHSRAQNTSTHARPQNTSESANSRRSFTSMSDADMDSSESSEEDEDTTLTQLRDYGQDESGTMTSRRPTVSSGSHSSHSRDYSVNSDTTGNSVDVSLSSSTERNTFGATSSGEQSYEHSSERSDNVSE